jgi:myosin X
VEQEFLFEQAHESVMKKHFPSTDEGLIKLAALRTQYVVGDYIDGAYISDLVKVHPAQAQPLMVMGGGIAGTLKKAGGTLKKAFKGTLRGLGSSTLRKLKGQGTIKKSEQISEEDLQKIKDAIVQQWMQYKGMSANDARLAYMDEIHQWNGYGANLFNVEQVSKKEWPKELWLAISLEGVGIYPRGERKSLAFHRYESVLSFGAPVANKYKIMVDNVGSMLFDTDMVLEIAKLMKEYIKEIVTRRP